MRYLAIPAAAALLWASASVAHGAAALAAGAKTSAKPTATNPVQRQMQIAADPIGITDFQFSLFFDSRLLQVAQNVDDQFLIRGINGYVLGLRDNPDAPAFAINFERGIVSVRGYWPASNGQVPQEEIDVYDVVFQLRATDDQGVPIPLTQPFRVDAGGAGGRESPFGPNFPDFMLGGLMDLQTGRPIIERTYGADLEAPNGILPSTTGIVAIVPEPAALGLLVPVALGLLRRR
jgi:hypothetical protein